MEGLSLTPGLAGLVPVVPTDAHHLVLAEKSEDLFLIYFFLLVFSTLVLFSGMPGNFLIEYWTFYVKMGVDSRRVYGGSRLNMGRSFCPVKAGLFPVYPHSWNINHLSSLSSLTHSGFRFFLLSL